MRVQRSRLKSLFFLNAQHQLVLFRKKNKVYIKKEEHDLSYGHKIEKKNTAQETSVRIFRLRAFDGISFNAFYIQINYTNNHKVYCALRILCVLKEYTISTKSLSWYNRYNNIFFYVLLLLLHDISYNRLKISKSVHF